MLVALSVFHVIAVVFGVKAKLQKQRIPTVLRYTLLGALMTLYSQSKSVEFNILQGENYSKL